MSKKVSIGISSASVGKSKFKEAGSKLNFFILLLGSPDPKFITNILSISPSAFGVLAQKEVVKIDCSFFLSFTNAFF